MARLNSFPFRLQTLPWLIAVGLAAPAVAQTGGDTRVAALGEVVVSGSRSAQNKDDLAATVEVVNRETIESQQINDIRDLARDLPNVSVQRPPARFGMATNNTGRDGNAGFNIRGLDGNRVLLLTDGIRSPRSYVFSANAFGRDYFDIGLVERVEFIKGPASALYGSDGLAGLVNFITREPSTFLRDGKRIGGSASLGYSGDDNGWRTGLTLAGQPSEALQWLLSANLNRAHALENKGENNAANVDRTTPNPQRDKGNSVLAKVILTPNADQKHSFTFEHVEKSSTYDLLSGRAKAPLAATSVIGLGAKNDLQLDRLTWDGRLRVRSALADNLQAVVSYQKAHSRSYAAEDRNTAADRVRNTTYDEDTLQLTLQADKTLRMGNDWSQRITYGFDYSLANIESLQTGLVPPAGETFPLKRFPDTREKTAAVYLQDEFIHDRWSITPGVRLDRFDLDADQAGFNARAVSLSGSAVSPKLGVLFRATPQWSVYGNYAAGFRAPSAFQVNNFFENVTSGYRTIPNPDLKPEKSQNFEVGVRGRTGLLQFDVAAFTGDYKNLIENDRLVSGRGTLADPSIFQSINIGRARISGFEFKGELDWTDNGRGFSVPFAYGQTRGRDRSNNQPLNSVNPQKLSVGLKYQAPEWSVRLDAEHHAAKKLKDVNRTEMTSGVQFVTPSATTFDLSGQWRIRKDLRLNVALVNLTDKKYWMWSDVRGIAQTSSVIDAYTQPGRHVNVSLVADF